MKILVTVFAVVLLLAAGAAGVVYSGWYNVAASEPHLAVTEAVMHATMRRSVKARAAGIRAPDISSADMIKQGASHYPENCQVCHGAPGIKPGEIGQGLMPPAPDLTKTAPGWSAAELFWIVKHGVKMTGMPAWGATHDDDEIWTIVAFTARLPQMSAEEYKGLTQDTSAHSHKHNKGHRY